MMYYAIRDVRSRIVYGIGNTEEEAWEMALEKIKCGAISTENLEVSAIIKNEGI